MKKTFTINISGTIFHIDEDAYEKLRNYLGLIHKRFSKNEEGKEIILDIESRIAELFTDCLQESKEVVSLGDVEEVIEIMGDPNEFDEAEESSSETEYKPGSKFKTGKRLYRDSDTRIFGGVAAGIGAYFGIDPVIIRILFIITAFFQIGIVAYVILWIAVPLARTTAQKLEMRGERVTVSNIEKSITEEFDEVKSNFRNFKNSKGYTRTKENISPVLEGLGLVFIAVGKILVVLFGISFIVLGVLVIFGFVGTFYSGYWFGFSPFEFDLLSDTGLFGWIADINNIRILTVSLILLIGIPILAIIYGGIKMIFRFNANHKLVGSIGLSLWVVGLIMAVAAVFMEGSNFTSSSIERSTHELNEFNSPVLFVNTFPDTLSDYFEYDYVFGMGEVKVVHDIDDYRIFIEPKIKIVKSNEDYFEMIEKKTSRGKSRSDARENASEIIYKWEQNDSLILIDNYFTLPYEEKWRHQELELILKVPVGRRIKIDRSLKRIAWNSEYNGGYYWPGDLVGKEWQMTHNGLIKVRYQKK